MYGWYGWELENIEIDRRWVLHTEEWATKEKWSRCREAQGPEDKFLYNFLRTQSVSAYILQGFFTTCMVKP